MVPRADEFECQGQRSKVKVTRDKNARCHSHHLRQRTNGTRSLQTTSRSSGRHHSVAAGGFRRPACGVCFIKNLYSVALVFLCNLLNKYHLTDQVIFFTQNVNQRTLGKAHTSSIVSLTARGWCAIPTKGPFNTRERAYSRESVAMELIESNDDVQVQTARIRACPRGVKAFRACPC